MKKTAYVCGPFAELPYRFKRKARTTYRKIAGLFEKLTGNRAFVPLEYFDTGRYTVLTSAEVDAETREIIGTQTSLLVVLALSPSWEGGIEIEIARQNNVPVWLLCPRRKLHGHKIHRLLRGNPAVKETIVYGSRKDALYELREKILELERGKA